MKTQQELCDILGFIAEYATYQLGSGVHTSRAVRNSRRIGEALGVDVQLSSFQKSTILTVLDLGSGESATRVVAIPSLPISFERNSDLSALSWDALDEGLSLDEIRSRYRTLVDKPRMDPIFTLVFVGLANASFCKLFGGDWTAVGIVFTATLVGFAVKQRMQAHAVNHFLVFACSAFVASLCPRPPCVSTAQPRSLWPPVRCFSCRACRSSTGSSTSWKDTSLWVSAGWSTPCC